MAAPDHLGLQFAHSYRRVLSHTEEEGYHNIDLHTVVAQRGADEVGSLTWSRYGVGNVEVPEHLRRQGIATAMWQHAHTLADEHIPTPRHSVLLSDEGRAWARSVGD